MKKVVLILCLTLSISAVWANSEKAMNKMLEGWKGKSLETVVEKWGKADESEGNKYIWKEEKLESTPNTTLGNIYDPRNHNIDQTARWQEAYKDGSFTLKRVCNRILEVDENYIVINGSYEGNACPATSVGTGKWKYKD